MSDPGAEPAEHIREQQRGRLDEELASVERAIAALEEQRSSLGDTVVETALGPLRARRADLLAPRSEQRRLVTVVFADLVDFTVLSRALDPEDTRDVVGAYFARWQQVIEEQGGVVEKFIGDAVMAVFGLSRSYEDDAQRAVRAALTMLEELPSLSERVGRDLGVELHMRVGIDTGEVVVSTLDERAGHDFVAVGPTVNRAARLQATAPVDRVMVSADTQRLIRGTFVLETRPGLELKGIDEPVDAFVVTAERRQEFRLDPSGGVEGVHTDTVGRDLHLRFLQDRFWDVVDESRWRVVTVMGDAGVGKSRLLFDFDAWLADRPEPVWWFRGRASPSSQSGVNFLLRDVLTSRLDIQINDGREEVRERFLAGFVTAAGPEEGPRLATLVGAWLGFDLDPDAQVPTDPQTLRDQGTNALGEYFRRLSEQAPVLMMLEDLHWADEGTLRWLDAVAPVLAEARVLVVGTTRPVLLESHPRWGEGLSHHARLTLTPLSRRESRDLVRQLLKHVDQPPRELADRLIEIAEGNPFYLEELVNWLIDSGVIVRGEPHWIVVDELVNRVAVPSTLKGVLQARLDALSHEERDLLQRASVIGRVFWDQAVAHLDDRDSDADRARGQLENLRRRDVVLQREVSRFATAREFLFKHALLRDVSYDGVLRAHRERYHRRTAEWLAETSAAVGREDEYAAVIAEHYEKGRDPAAATWYLRAGVQAASVYALIEADQLLGRALALVSEDDPQLRFDILLAREQLLDRKGEREQQQATLEDMASLVDRIDVSRRIRLDLVRSAALFVHSDYTHASELATRAVGLAGEAKDDVLLAEATLANGKALTWAGEGADAEQCLDEAVRLADRTGQESLLGESLRYLSMLRSNQGDYARSVELGQQARQVFARAGEKELESTALAQLATTYFNMGRYADAQVALEESLPIFRRSGHRYREGIVLGNLASVALMQNRFADSERWSREAIDLLDYIEDVESGVSYRLVLGAIATVTSRFAVASQTLEEALAAATSVGSAAQRSECYARLATVRLEQGERKEALELARKGVEASRDAPSAQESAFASLALGYTALASGLPDEAEEAFADAEHHFRTLELPSPAREAEVGRARVASVRGETDRAVELLEPVLEHLDPAGLAQTWQHGELLAGCWDVLRAAGDPRTGEVLAQARTFLHGVAEEIGDPDMARGYLDFPVHARLLAGGEPDQQLAKMTGPSYRSEST